MAVPGKLGVTTGKTGVGAKPSLDLHKKQSDILGKMGLNDVDQLGPNAKDTLRGILEGNKGRLEGLDPLDVAQKLQRDVANDVAESFTPSITKPDKCLISGRLSTTKEVGKGQFKLVGEMSGSKHPVNQLMQELQDQGYAISPNSFGPEVNKVIQGAARKEVELGNEKNWDKFSSKLARAAVLDTPVGKLGKTAASSSRGVTAAGAVDSGAVGLGLNKTARDVNDATPVDVAASPEHVATAKTESAKQRHAETVDKLAAVFADAGLTEEQTQDLKASLGRALRFSASDKTDDQRAFSILKNTQAELNGGKQMDVPGAEVPELGAANVAVAAFSLVQLAQLKGGANVPNAAAGDVTGILVDYISGGGSTAKKSKIKSASDKLGKIKTGGPKNGTTGGARVAGGRGGARGSKGPNINGKVRQQASEFAQKIGIDVADPGEAETIQGIEKAFGKVLGDGKKTDREVINDGLKWLNKQSGGAEVGLDKVAKGILGLPPDGEGNPELEGKLKERVLQQVALCGSIGPEAYKALGEKQAAAAKQIAAQNGGTTPPFGANIPGYPKLWDEFGVTSPIGRQAMGSSILYDPSLSHEDKILLFLMLMSKFLDQDRQREMRDIGNMNPADASKKAVAGQAAQAGMSKITGGKIPPPGGAQPGVTTSGATTTEDKTSMIKDAVDATKGDKTGPKTSDPKTSAQATSTDGAKDTSGAPPDTPDVRTADGSDGPKPPGGDDKVAGADGVPPEGQANPQLANDPSVTGETSEAYDVKFARLDRIGKMRDNLMEILNSIMKQMAQNTDRVIQSMTR